MFKIKYGYIPHAVIYSESRFFAPGWAAHRAAIPYDPVLGKIPQELVDNGLVKRCEECGRWHPATTDYWTKNGRGKFGLYSLCKRCKRAADNARYRRRSRRR